MRAGQLRAEQLPFFEDAPQLPGYGGRRVDDRSLRADNLFDKGLHEGIMGTTQDKSIGAGSQHRFQDTAQESLRFQAVQLAGFDPFHQAGTGVFQQLYIFGEAVHEAGVTLAFEGAGGGQYAYFARAGSQGAGFYSRFHADKKDSQCLSPILEGLKENLHTEGLIIEQILADTGYSSGTALKALEHHNITGYIPNFGKYKPEREGFQYHKEYDYYTCPQNKKVEFKKIKRNNGHLVKEYRTSRADCGPCPFRTSCIGKSPEKKIVNTLDKPYYDQMHARLKTSYAKKMKKLRQSTVEPVLGTLVNFMGMKRVNTRGIKLANKCMLMAAIAYNIKKALKFKNSRPPMAAMASLRKEANYLFSMIFYQYETVPSEQNEKSAGASSYQQGYQQLAIMEK